MHTHTPQHPHPSWQILVVHIHHWKHAIGGAQATVHAHIHIHSSMAKMIPFPCTWHATLTRSFSLQLTNANKEYEHLNNEISVFTHYLFFQRNCKGSTKPWTRMVAFCSQSKNLVLARDPEESDEVKSRVKQRARPGFGPGTSRTQSENHTPRPTSQRKRLPWCRLAGFAADSPRAAET